MHLSSTKLRIQSLKDNNTLQKKSVRYQELYINHASSHLLPTILVASTWHIYTERLPYRRASAAQLFFCMAYKHWTPWFFFFFLGCLSYTSGIPLAIDLVFVIEPIANWRGIQSTMEKTKVQRLWIDCDSFMLSAWTMNVSILSFGISVDCTLLQAFQVFHV